MGARELAPARHARPKTCATWTAIPRYNVNIWADGYISSTAYHHRTNVQAGRGDICKLVGYTAAQVRAWTDATFPANPKWRLPTRIENNVIAGDQIPYGVDDTITPGTVSFETGYELPMLGYRHTDGVG